MLSARLAREHAKPLLGYHVISYQKNENGFYHIHHMCHMQAHIKIIEDVMRKRGQVNWKQPERGKIVYVPEKMVIMGHNAVTVQIIAHVGVRSR